MGSPRAPEQDHVERRLVEMMANAGLRTSLMRTMANAIEMTVTPADLFSPLFVVHAAFYTGQASGCIRRPNENPSEGAPLFVAKAACDRVPPERTFKATIEGIESLEPLLRMAAVEASAYAVAAPNGEEAEGIGRELLEMVRLAVTENGATAVVASLQRFLIERARESNDPALLEEALAALERGSPEPGPTPR